MKNNPEIQPHMRALRHNLKVMAFAVLGVVLGACIGYGAVLLFKTTPVVQDEIIENNVSTTSPEFARSAPVRLVIPKLKLDTTFEDPLGLNEDQTIEVPDSYTKVGWYKNGPTPGEVGPAVILGHVDSYEGPAIFWPLRQLTEGDEIRIERADGTTAIFKVDTMETYDQNDFPTELVYGKTEDSQLRLITCIGTYNKGIQRYSHNLVVYATLVEPKDPS